jgi:hypothetical protein
MYILYLDDSGSSKNPAESHIVLGGFIVPEEKLYWINKNLDSLATELSLPSNTEFHASEISGGRTEPWKRIQRPERYEILKNVLKSAEFALNNISILACAVEKAHYPNDDPMLIAFEDICSRFQLFLQRQYSQNKGHSLGFIIIDESSYKESLQGLVKHFQTRGNKWNYKLDCINEAPMFVDSKISRGIQLADHIAYAVFRRYDACDLTYYNVIEGYFDSDNGKIHGLCHKTNNKNCTCAHCAQKKIL